MKHKEKTFTNLSKNTAGEERRKNERKKIKENEEKRKAITKLFALQANAIKD